MSFAKIDFGFTGEPTVSGTQFAQAVLLPLIAEARQALLAGEQFLRRALFDLALLGDELLNGFDEGIRIGEGLGDGFLFGFGGWEGNANLLENPNGKFHSRCSDCSCVQSPLNWSRLQHLVAESRIQAITRS